MIEDLIEDFGTKLVVTFVAYFFIGVISVGCGILTLVGTGAILNLF